LFHTRILGSVLPFFLVFLFSFSIKREISINDFQNSFLEIIHIIFEQQIYNTLKITNKKLQKSFTNKHNLYYLEGCGEISYMTALSVSFLFILVQILMARGFAPRRWLGTDKKECYIQEFLDMFSLFSLFSSFSFSEKGRFQQNISKTTFQK